jgi:hypothetical protein
MQQVHDTQRTASSISRFKWVIGTPYFVQGTSDLATVPILYFIKFGLGLGDPFLMALANVPPTCWKEQSVRASTAC